MKKLILLITFFLFNFTSSFADKTYFIDFNKVLNNNFLVYLGTISYGIYMIHAFVWWIWIQLLKYVFYMPIVMNSEGKQIIIIDNAYLADMISFTGVAVIILLAHLSYRYFERVFAK